MSNIEIADKPGQWVPMEKRKRGKDRPVSTRWLSDVDAMVQEMIGALTTSINQD